MSEPLTDEEISRLRREYGPWHIAYADIRNLLDEIERLRSIKHNVEEQAHG